WGGTSRSRPELEEVDEIVVSRGELGARSPMPAARNRSSSSERHEIYPAVGRWREVAASELQARARRRRWSGGGAPGFRFLVDFNGPSSILVGVAPTVVFEHGRS
ncbi:unnamed protein product, partial [Urochloa humidicola]